MEKKENNYLNGTNDQMNIYKSLLWPIVILTSIYVVLTGVFLCVTNWIIAGDYKWSVYIIIFILSVAYLLSILILWRYNVESQKTRRTEINANKKTK